MKMKSADIDIHGDEQFDSICPSDKPGSLASLARARLASAEPVFAEHFARRALQQAARGSAEAHVAHAVLARTRSRGGDLRAALAHCDELNGCSAALRREILLAWGDVRGAAEADAAHRVEDALCADAGEVENRTATGRTERGVPDDSGGIKDRAAGAVLDDATAAEERVAADAARGTLALELDDPAQARSIALALVRGASARGRAHGYALLSRVDLAQDASRSAAALARRAVIEARADAERGPRVAARMAQSLAEEARGYLRRARRAAEAALGHARRGLDRPAQVRAHLRLSQLASAEHDPATAMAHAEGALSLLPPQTPGPLLAEALLRAAIASRQLATALAAGPGIGDDRGAAAAAERLREQAEASAGELATHGEVDPLGAPALLGAELALEWGDPRAMRELVERWREIGRPAGGAWGGALHFARLAVRAQRSSDALAALDQARPTERGSIAGRATHAIALRQTGRLHEAIALLGGRGGSSPARAPEAVRPRGRPRTLRLMPEPATPATAPGLPGADPGRAAGRPALRALRGGAADAAGLREPLGDHSTSTDGGDPRLDAGADPWAGVCATAHPGPDPVQARVQRHAGASVLLLRARECVARDLGWRVEAQLARTRWLAAAAASPGRAVALLAAYGLAGEATLSLTGPEGALPVTPEEVALLLPGPHLDVLLDTERQLVHCADGRSVDLEILPKLMEALELLLREAPRTLDRATFYRRLWRTEYDPEIHEQKVVKTLQRLRRLLGDDAQGRSVLLFSIDSRIGFRPGLRVALLEQRAAGGPALSIRQCRILAELAIEPRSPAQLALLVGAPQLALSAELAELGRLGRVERTGHGRGTRYVLVRAKEGRRMRRAA